MTGITRSAAAKIIGEHFGTSGDFLCTDEKLAVTIPDAFLLIQGDRSIQESADSNAIQVLLPLLTGSGA